MRARSLVAFVLCSLYGGSAVLAQETSSQSAILRGTVSSSAGERLAYAIVSIPSLNLQQFSSTDGRFNFVQLKPGKYVVSIRQLGYSPVTQAVDLAAGAVESINVRMDRIVTKLTAFNVTALWSCERPGRPMADTLRPLIEVFEQIEQNAVRLKLLSQEYPYQILTERRIVNLRADGSEFVESHDSIRTSGPVVARYKRGNVVQRSGPRARRQYALQVPTLLDFADPGFQQNHCFLLRGVSERGGQSEVRVDFLPSSKIKDPDVGGSVFLAAGSFRLLRSEIFLTKIPNGLEGLAGLQATTYFDDVVKGLPAISEIIARSDFKGVKGPPQFERGIEHQKTLEVLFLRGKPAEVPPSERAATGKR